LDFVTQLNNLLRATPGFIVNHQFNLTSDEPLSNVGSRQFTIINPARNQLRTVFRWDTESGGACASEKRGNAYLYGLRNSCTAAKRDSAC
jgi:hypothetical protein